MIFLANCTHKGIKSDGEISAKWKEVKGKPDKINGLILKKKTDQKEGPYNISHTWIIFSFDWLSFREREFRLKLDVQGRGSRRIFDVDGQGGWDGILKIG